MASLQEGSCTIISAMVSLQDMLRCCCFKVGVMLRPGTLYVHLLLNHMQPLVLASLLGTLHETRCSTGRWMQTWRI